jgi:hypothetical protein
VVVGAGFGGGANGWAFEVGGLAASALGAASVVAAGGRLASCADRGRDADGQLTVDSRQSTVSGTGLLTLYLGRRLGL